LATSEADVPLVFVADTYNNKLKRLDPIARLVRSLAGSGPGHEDGDHAGSRFWELSGLSLARSQLYLADTNNLVVGVIELDTGTVSTLEIRGTWKVET
jgi:hypothetical protein